MNQKNYRVNLNNGDEELFYTLFEKFYLQLFRFATTYLSDAEGPEDIVQEAFIKLWRQRLYFRQMNTIQSFLFTTVKNQCLNIRKHRKVIQRYNQYYLLNNGNVSEPLAYENLDTIQEDTCKSIHNTLHSLPMGCRRVMQMSFMQGLKNKEIANDLCVSVNTVKTQKRRGIKAFRMALS